LKRREADIQSAKHAPPPPAEPVDVVTIFPAHAAQMKQLERRSVARRAVGAEDLTDIAAVFSVAPPEPDVRLSPNLSDVFGDAER